MNYSTNEKIVIGQYVDGLGTGGIESFVTNIYRHIDRKQFHFDYIVSYPQNSDLAREIKSLGGSISPILSNKLSKLTAFDKIKKAILFAKLVRRRKYEILHINMSYPSTLLYCFIAKINGARHVIGHAHANQYGEISSTYKIISKLARSLFADSCDLYLAPSKSAGEFVFGNRDIEIIHNGIDVSRFKFSENERETFRKTLGIEPDTKLIGHVGRFSEVKNHMFIVDVYEEYRKYNKDSKLIFIGAGSLMEKVKAYVNERGLAGNVIFYGTTNHVEEAMSGMDLFIFPSKYEGLGIAAVEAQTSGMPVIMSDSIPDEAIITEYCYRVSLKKTAAEWAWIIENKMNSLARDNDGFNKVMMAGYDINDVTRKLEDIYKKTWRDNYVQKTIHNR